VSGSPRAEGHRRWLLVDPFGRPPRAQATKGATERAWRQSPPEKANPRPQSPASAERAGVPARPGLQRPLPASSWKSASGNRGHVLSLARCHRSSRGNRPHKSGRQVAPDNRRRSVRQRDGSGSQGRRELATGRREGPPSIRSRAAPGLPPTHPPAREGKHKGRKEDTHQRKLIPSHALA